MKTFKASLIATGVGAALAMTLSGPAMAWDSGGSDPVINNTDDGSAAAANHASASVTDIGFDDITLSMRSASTNVRGSVHDNGATHNYGNGGGDGGHAGDAEGGSGGKHHQWLSMYKTGNGAGGGDGGDANGGSAGMFSVSNTIANSSFRGAAGIMNVSQNSGANSLTQQAVTVQGNIGSL